VKVTLIERAPGHWRLRMEVGQDAEGKRLFRYETVRGSREDAERRRFAILHQHEEGTFATPEKITLATFFERWMETRKALKKIRRTSVENYQTMFRAYVAPVLGSKRLQAITGPDIQGLYVTIANGGRLSDASLRHLHRIMAALFHAARKARVLKVNPMEEVEAPMATRPKPKALSEEDARRLLVIGNIRSRS
jgi:integrase